MESINDKKIKNLVSIAILLGGLFIGSLFVDVAQVIRGGGFSVKNLSKSDIFAANGKTWVAYSEPAVNVKVINDDSCVDCDSSEVLVWFRRVLPTISTEKINFDSPEGKQLISQFGIKTLPAFIFDNKLIETDFYTQANILFEQKEESYILKAQELGLEPGKYLETPEVKETNATFGNANTNTKVVVFSDFQCPYCNIFWRTLRDTMKTYGDKTLFAYKHFPIDSHPQANNAALASSCAQEQDKFWEYGDKLYATQDSWGKLVGTQKFKDYARTLGLDTAKFNKCLDSKQYQSVIDADKSEAMNFGLSGTPAIFINSQLKKGVVSVVDLQTAIDQELAK
jgi:protein-disulfide isomerase